MEPIKLSKNVEFEVIYEDGTRKRVREGILFEAEGGHMILHNGTDREVVFVSVLEACAEVMCETGRFVTLIGCLGRMEKMLVEAVETPEEDKA